MFPLFLLTVGLTQHTLPDFDAVKSAALAARRSIRTAEVTIRRTINDGSGDQSQAWRVWMDGNKVRGDYTPNPPEPTERLVHCVGCERADWGLYYTEKKNVAAQFRPAREFAAGELFAAVSPRHFGYTLSRVTSSWRVGFEGLFGSPHDGSKSVAAAEVDGVKCWRLGWTTGSKERPVTWLALISPDQGNQIVLVQAEGVSAGKPFRETTRSKLKKWGNVWYPESITFEQTSGGAVATREVATVSAARLNEPIDPSVFTFDGIAMLPAVPVAMPNRKENGFIREGKIVPVSAQPGGVQPAPLPPPMPVQAGSANPWLLAVCGVLAVAAGFLLLRKFRTRRAAP